MKYIAQKRNFPFANEVDIVRQIITPTPEVEISVELLYKYARERGANGTSQEVQPGAYKIY